MNKNGTNQFEPHKKTFSKLSTPNHNHGHILELPNILGK